MGKKLGKCHLETIIKTGSGMTHYQVLQLIGRGLPHATQELREETWQTSFSRQQSFSKRLTLHLFLLNLDRASKSADCMRYIP